MCINSNNLCEQTRDGFFDFTFSILLKDSIQGHKWVHFIIIDHFIWNVEIVVKNTEIKPKVNYTGIERPFIKGKYDLGFRVFNEKYGHNLCFYSVRIHKNLNFKSKFEFIYLERSQTFSLLRFFKDKYEINYDFNDFNA
jgi:hypothetical protein